MKTRRFSNAMEIYIDNTVYLISYSTPVAILSERGKVKLTKDKYSASTTRQINKFCKRHGIDENANYIELVSEETLITLCKEVNINLHW